MDKLKPVLTHKFWIFFGVALLLPVIGWGMASGTMGEFIEKRTTELDGKLNNMKNGSGLPNPSWTAQLAAMNDKHATLNRTTHTQLWSRQKELHVWPTRIKQQMESIAYREAPESAGGEYVAVRDNYRVEYPRELERAWRLAHPIETDATTLVSRGTVLFPLSAVPQHSPADWKGSPSWQEVWNAQEDIWLVSELCQAIADVNNEAPSIRDAYIKQIEEMTLFGADRVGQGGGAAPGMGVEGGYMDPMMAEYAGGGAGFGNMMMEAQTDYTGGMAGGGGFNLAPLPVEIDLSEDFDNLEALTGMGAAGQTGMGRGMGGGSSMMEYAAEMGSADAMGMATATAAPAEAIQTRYIDKGDTQPYRTRGFMLKVVIDQMRVPEFLAELTNSPWPVEIVRVHYASRDSGPRAANRGGAGRMGGGYSGSSMLGRGAGAAGQRIDPEMQRIVNDALADPNLATVAVVGLMTLYNPPPDSADAASLEAAEAAGEAAAAEAAAEAEAAANAGNAPADPAATPNTAPPTTTAPAQPGAAAPTGPQAVPAEGTPAPNAPQAAPADAPMPQPADAPDPQGEAPATTAGDEDAQDTNPEAADAVAPAATNEPAPESPAPESP